MVFKFDILNVILESINSNARAINGQSNLSCIITRSPRTAKDWDEDDEGDEGDEDDEDALPPLIGSAVSI